jgi:hypothetical protein
MTFYRLFKMYRTHGYSVKRALARAWEVSNYA